jgi:tetratricopeptide (TPR) repeat protein
MINDKRTLLALVAGLAISVGSAWAEEKAPAAAASTPAAKAPEAKAAKPAKQDSPTVAAMKAAIALADAGKTDEAIVAYEKIGVLKSKKMEAWRLNNEALAYITAKEAKYDKALPLLEKAVEADAANQIAWNNLGSTYENLGQLEKAKDAYQKSIDAAKAANVSSAKAEGNLAALQPRLDKLAVKKGDAKDDAKETESKAPDQGAAKK